MVFFLGVIGLVDLLVGFGVFGVGVVGVGMMGLRSRVLWWLLFLMVMWSVGVVRVVWVVLFLLVGMKLWMWSLCRLLRVSLVFILLVCV